MRGRVPLLLAAATLVVAGAAHSKSKKLKGETRALADVEARVKALPKAKNAPEAFDGLTEWLGVAAVSCPTDACDSVVSAKLLSGNVDGDAELEKVLVVVTRGAGDCATTSLEVLVLDPVAGGKDVKLVAHTRLSTRGGKDTVADASLAKVHSAALDDLVLRVDGRCGKGPREHVVRVHTLESGRLEEIASSEDVAGKELESHALSGGPPATIDFATGKGKTKVSFDAAYGYDPYPSYDTAKKGAMSKQDDETLLPNECSAPLGTNLAADCDLSGSAKIEVLVQNGKALGLTVTVTPASLPTTRCLRQKVATSTWKSVPGASGCTRSFKVSG